MHATAVVLVMVACCLMVVANAQTTTDTPTTAVPPTATDSGNATTAAPSGGNATTTTSAPTTTTTTVAPPPPTTATTIAPPPPPSPTNATITSVPIEYPVIVVGGIVIFTLVIGACYVTFMWQQKALRLYKATFEEVIKDRGKARREIQEVFLRGENRVFDYKAKDDSDDDNAMMDDLSPVAMRARILGQSYTAAKYVEKKNVHPLTVAPHPSTYVGKGPVYFAPRSHAHGVDGTMDMMEDEGRHGAAASPSVWSPPAGRNVTTPPSTASLMFDDMTMRSSGGMRRPSEAADTNVARGDMSSGASATTSRGSFSAQRQIIAQSLDVHLAIQELQGHAALRNVHHASSSAL